MWRGDNNNRAEMEEHFLSSMKYLKKTDITPKCLLNSTTTSCSTEKQIENRGEPGPNCTLTI